MEYPALLYRSSGGSSFDHIPVTNEGEHLRLLDEGWCESVPEALRRAGRPSPAQEREAKEEVERKAQAEREASAAEAARIAEEQHPKPEPAPTHDHKPQHDHKPKKH